MRRIHAHLLAAVFLLVAASPPPNTDRSEREPPLQRVLRFVVKALSNDPILPRP